MLFRSGRRRLLLEGIGHAVGCCWRLLTASVSTVICHTIAAICASVVTAGCGELGSAAEGGGEASSRREERLADPVTLDRWALVFVISIYCLRMPAPYLARQSVAANPLVAWSLGTSACKRKSALTGDGSGGDPPTVKSERRLGNSEKKAKNSTREREGEQACVFFFHASSTVAFPDIYSGA